LLERKVGANDHFWQGVPREAISYPQSILFVDRLTTKQIVL
jgi:hypothetical protein